MYTLYNPTSATYDTGIDYGLMVRITTGQAKMLVVRELPSLPLSMMQSSQDQFKPGRLVGNFVIVDAKSSKTIEAVLNPAIEVHITYDETDVKRLQAAYQAYLDAGRTDLPAPRAAVGYWDKTRWVEFTAETHHLRWVNAEPTVTNGWQPATAIVDITYWPDPPIAAGPP